MTNSAQDVTQLLHDWRGGNPEALHRLMPLVYDELRHIASAYLRRERAGHTLQTAGLVNEAYLRLINQTRADWQNRAHFYGIAARLMRRILTDHARERQAAKRDSGGEKFELDEALEIADGKATPDLIALDDALNTLAAFDERQSRIVELRYFGGLEINEVAEVLDISPATVKREWNSAKAWLYNQLSKR
jgi:RNA polymerase sigma factor (TIGR02999 family)